MFPGFLVSSCKILAECDEIGTKHYRIPLARPSVTLAPSDGERAGVRGSPLHPSVTLAPSDGERAGFRGRLAERSNRAPRS